MHNRHDDSATEKLNRAEIQAVEALRREAADLPDMSLDDINAEIKAARDERKKKL